jgi:hypothetical protein
MRAGDKFLWRPTLSKPAQVVVAVSVAGDGTVWGVLNGHDRRFEPEELAQARAEGRFVSLEAEEGSTDAEPTSETKAPDLEPGAEAGSETQELGGES